MRVLSEGWAWSTYSLYRLCVSVMLMSVTKPLNNYTLSMTLCNISLALKHINTLSWRSYLQRTHTCVDQCENIISSKTDTFDSQQISISLNCLFNILTALVKGCKNSINDNSVTFFTSTVILIKSVFQVCDVSLNQTQQQFNKLWTNTLLVLVKLSWVLLFWWQCLFKHFFDFVQIYINICYIHIKTHLLHANKTLFYQLINCYFSWYYVNCFLAKSHTTCSLWYGILSPP